ncbi:hypothetical protein AB4559_18090 [Vibrio sp. 10N.222.51.C8]|jgi:hypothetical protein|nr:hypothetical protein BCU68_13740 [Vibrio sp. 10N.286.49.B3]
MIMLPEHCDDIEANGLYDGMSIKTNNQNVRYSYNCHEDTPYLWPFSNQGNEFVIDAFKKSANVSFEFPHQFLFFSAHGFTKAWAEFGGDAL